MSSSDQNSPASTSDPAENKVPTSSEISQESSQLDQPLATDSSANEIKAVKISISSPNGAEIKLQLIGSELIQEIKQVILQSPETIEYSCFDLLYLDVPLENHLAIIDVVYPLPELSSEAEIIQGSAQTDRDLSLFDYESVYQFRILEKKYSERDARVHISRMKDLLEGARQVTDNKFSIDVGTTLFPIINESIIGKQKSPKNSSNTNSLSKQSKKGHKQKFSKGKSSVNNTKKSEIASQESINTSNKPKVKKYSLNATPPLTKISSIPWRNRIKPEQCIKGLILSGWNPVRPDRYQKGDLFYLQITTLEGQIYHVTSSINGFFVNNSTSSKFDPSRADPARESHSLISLVRKLSPRFTKSFDSLQKSVNSLFPLETVSISSCNQITAPWIVPSMNDSALSLQDDRQNDLGIIQQSLLKMGFRGSDSIRDWNEELQSIREMDTSSQNEYEGALKDNQMLVWLNEFTEAAIAGAIAVVDNDLLPLNPSELPEQYIYLRENIFFSKANDSRDLFAKLGGDNAASVAASKDVEGVQLLNGLDVNGLYQLGTVLVDYRGCRVIAQTVVPGILRVENENPVIYGSVDNGVTIKSNPDFHKLLEPVANQLRLKEHEIKDGEGETHTLYTSLDVKGIKGTDNRSYLVDLFRLFPVDSEFIRTECGELDDAELSPSDSQPINTKNPDYPVYPHKITLLRNELLTLYWESSVRNQVKEIVKNREESQHSTEAGADDSNIKSEQAGENSSTKESNESETPAAQKSDLELAREKVLESIVSLNQDAFVPLVQTENNKEFNDSVFENDKKFVSKASAFLHNEVIPGFVNELIIANLAPITGKSLSRHMHSRGINMRYLGTIANKLSSDDKSTQAIYHLIIREMITRSVKHLIRDIFKRVPDYTTHASIFAFVINSLFSIDTEKITEFDSIKPTLSHLNISSKSDVTDNIKEIVSTRFRFSLPENWIDEFVLPFKRIVLRESCIKCGVQIVLKNYDDLFSNKSNKSRIDLNDSNLSQSTSSLGCQDSNELPYLSSQDILNFVPVVRVAGSPVSLPSETLEFGRNMIAEGNKEMGLSLLHNLCLFHEQKCGNLHPTTARCYADLATIYHELDENSTAIELMHQAIIANERSSGVDDTETIYNYLNLAMFEHANKNTEVALNYIYHALDLWKLVGTLNHPILSVIYSNIAAMHQQLLVESSQKPESLNTNKTHDSLVFFEKSVSLRESLYGTENVLTASSALNYAKAIASTGDFKLAVSKVKSAHAVFKEKLGAEDPKTLDAKDWLDSLTVMAVEKAKNEKDIAEAKLINERNILLGKKGLQTISSEDLISSINSNSKNMQILQQKTANSNGKKGSSSSKKNSKAGDMTIDDLYNFIVGSDKTLKPISNKNKTAEKANRKKKN
ncbi:Clustered mitochondria protein-like protein [Smittium culicis]|uniref:Clustered mitochondria protein-like protein n=1 Tax=Smittium culicis TaxID=133412 RepID=A0A1R1XY63_9FUNG|nr:Clustered mitochondria protein-like protein [Smittium culicis]